MVVRQPLELTETVEKFDIYVTVSVVVSAVKLVQSATVSLAL
jgi:ribosomal protein S9